MIPGEGKSGLALRTFDLKRGLWSIYWLSSSDGLLQPPLVGRFEDGMGREGDDSDDGASWETNWTMDFARLTG